MTAILTFCEWFWDWNDSLVLMTRPAGCIYSCCDTRWCNEELLSTDYVWITLGHLTFRSTVVNMCTTCFNIKYIDTSNKLTQHL